MSEVLPIVSATGSRAPSFSVHAAEVLAELSAEIEQLGAELCTSTEIVSTHMSTLQGIDLIAQKLAALANMLAADCPTTALEQVRLEALRKRFFTHQC